MENPAAPSGPIEPDGPYQDVTGVILAGGQSRRMGTDKARLKVDGVPLLDRVARVFRRTFSANLVIANDPGLYLGLGLPVHTDVYPNRGSLVGIYTGLLNAETPYIFCASCDMPFLNERLIRFLVDLRAGFDWVLPFSGHGREPLHAVYGKGCLGPMERLIAEDNLAIVGIASEVRTRRVAAEEVAALDPKFLSFMNCNTPEDLEAAAALARELRGEGFS
ncbi:MAG: molybdenum cofactor guanylyltransferase [Candidatus Tectomicrobia bacterium]|nr:molybdenum cofactor guanylyltransferase [Candidatus Tectomicrobia bacterium]